MNLSSLNIDFSQLFNDPVHFFEQLFSQISTATFIGYAFLFFLIVWGFTLARKYAAMRGSADSGFSLREAEAARSQDPYRAAELFEQAGQYDQAIRAYKEAKAYQPIGRIYEQKKEWEQAAQFYKLGGNGEKSATMYQRGGDYLRAAEEYLSCKKISMAAEMYEKGKRYRDAAIQYEKSGNLSKAAVLYEQSNDFEKAAEKYETYFLKQKMANPGLSPEKTKQLNHLAHQSGQLYMKAKKFKKAMELFSAAGFPSEAAEAALQAGETDKAAELFVAAHLFDKAALLYEKLGNSRQGQRVIAKKYVEEQDFASAARAFETGESWIEAAEMYERIGEKLKSGEMYMNGGDYHRSADCFLAGGDEASAAQSFEKGGRLKDAADLYLKLGLYEKAAQMQEAAGNYYSAALLVKEQGRIDQSISYLQKVDSRSGDYYQATLLLGQMLIDRGMIQAARERLQKVVSQEPISSHNLEFYYQLALLHEKGKEFEEAQGLYEKILAEDFNYKDVKGRSDLLKKALAEVKKVIDASRVERPPERPVLPSSETPARYKIIKKIGQGGMGVVYQAEDTILKRVVAYKVLPQAIKENEAMLQNFLQEARIAAALNHPNVVTLFDTGKNGEEIFITMEYVDGISLKEYLETKPLSVAEMVGIMKSICKGVAYAHSKNVVHRDLKPANVMLAKDKTVKIMDFGLAKMVTDSVADKTSVKGTPLYMAPEQILGEKVDHQSDIYSLGCTFYRMVAGRPPFTQGDVYYHHLHTAPASPVTFNSGLPGDLEKIILKCIEKKKEKRYKVVTEIFDDLVLLG